jgi:hypothetical protein
MDFNRKVFNFIIACVVSIATIFIAVVVVVVVVFKYEPTMMY